ncbi:hypothetical protein [Erythrobacter aureus]|nr:hypothetical protein [Erythrobacter aureus]
MTDFANDVLESLKGHTGVAEVQWSDLARLIANKHSLFTGREACAFENILAQAISYASPYHFPMPEHYKALSAKAAPMVASAIGMRNKFTIDADCETIIDYFNAAFNAVVEREYALSLSEDTAATLLRTQVEELAVQYPDLGLSFGYIGNLSIGPIHDDRSWKVFTKCATPRCHGASDVSWGGYATKNLGLMHVAARKSLADWCQQKSDLLAAREIRSLVPQAA